MPRTNGRATGAAGLEVSRWPGLQVPQVDEEGERGACLSDAYSPVACILAISDLFIFNGPPLAATWVATWGCF